MKKASLLFALLFGFCHLVSAADSSSAPRPNIVLIMADDMGFSDLGCYGSEIKTPNLDRLAHEGLRFTQFYNNAKCTTTRASLVTGLYPRQTGPLLKRNMVTFGEALKLAGYQTALIGKWHLGSKPGSRPFDRGFDEYYGLMDGCCNYFDPAQRDPDFKGGHLRVFGHNDELITNFPAGFYTTDAFTDHAVQTIRRFTRNRQPFFVHVCYTAPHYPLHAKPADIAKYRGKYAMGWEALRTQRHERQLAMGLIDPHWKMPPRDPLAAPWSSEANQDWQATRMEVYAAMVDCLDQGVGRILQALKDAGADRNTLVLFLSDNGGCSEHYGDDNPNHVVGIKETYATCGPGWAYAQNTPFRRYKTWMHEGGISTPLIARWPGHVRPDTRTSQVGHIIDMMPTFLELAGADYPKTYEGHSILPCEGLSLVPILEGQPRHGHDTLYWEYTGNRAIRQDNWKLVWDRTVRKWELYDVVKDRTETQNLAAENPERVQSMAATWESWAEETGVKRR